MTLPTDGTMGNLINISDVLRLVTHPGDIYMMISTKSFVVVAFLEQHVSFRLKRQRSFERLCKPTIR